MHQNGANQTELAVHKIRLRTYNLMDQRSTGTNSSTPEIVIFCMNYEEKCYCYVI